MKLDFCFKHVHFTLPALGYADQCYTPALISVFVCLAGLDTLTPNTPLIQLLGRKYYFQVHIPLLPGTPKLNQWRIRC